MTQATLILEHTQLAESWKVYRTLIDLLLLASVQHLRHISPANAKDDNRSSHQSQGYTVHDILTYWHWLVNAGNDTCMKQSNDYTLHKTLSRHQLQCLIDPSPLQLLKARFLTERPCVPQGLLCMKGCTYPAPVQPYLTTWCPFHTSIPMTGLPVDVQYVHTARLVSKQVRPITPLVVLHTGHMTVQSTYTHLQAVAQYIQHNISTSCLSTCKYNAGSLETVCTRLRKGRPDAVGHSYRTREYTAESLRELLLWEPRGKVGWLSPLYIHQGNHGLHRAEKERTNVTG